MGEGRTKTGKFLLRATASFLLSIVCCYVGYGWAETQHNIALFFIPIGGLVAVAVVLSTVLGRRGYITGILFAVVPPILLGLVMFLMLIVMCSGKASLH